MLVSWSFLRARVRFDSWSLPYWLALGLGAAGYYALAELGLAFVSSELGVSPVWPASGLAVAMVRLFGARMWPAIFIGALATGIFGQNPMVVLVSATGSALEGVVGGLIVSRVVDRYGDSFLMARVLAVLLAALWAALAGTAVGVAAIFFGGVGTTSLGPAWFTWWVGDALGIFIVTPALFALSRRHATGGGTRATAVRIAALAAAVGGIMLAISGGENAAVAIYLTFPTVIAAGHWFRLRGAAWSVVAIAIPLTAITASGGGAFVEAAAHDGLLDMQVFLATLALAGLLFVDLRSLDIRLPAGVLLVGVAVAAGVFVVERRALNQLDDTRFDRLIDAASARVRERMEVYINAMHAGASLYHASNHVTRGEWRDFTTSLRLTERYPGVIGMGVVVPVAPERMEEFLAQERSDMSDLQLKSYAGAGASRAPGDEHFVLLYFEPHEENASAIGIDLSSEPVRRAAAIRARDTGQPAVTAQVRLLRGSIDQSGFLYFLPVYRGLEPASTMAERLARFRGWIVAPFRTADFFGSALNELSDQIHAEVFTGGSGGAEQFVFTTMKHAARGAAEAGWHKTTTLLLVGQPFTLRWHRGPRFAEESRRDPVLVSCTIVLLATLLAALVANLQSLRQRAASLAEDMTKALAASNERLHVAINGMVDGFAVFDSEDRILLYNDGFLDAGTRRVFGSKVAGRTFEEIVRAFAYNGGIGPTGPDFDAETWIERRMEQHRNPPASPLEVQWSGGKWMRISERRTTDGGYVGIWSDVTEIKLAEQRLTAAIDAMDSGFALFDANDVLLVHNRGFVDDNIARNFGGDARGRTFEEIIRAFATNQVTLAGSDPVGEDWIRRRLERHRNPPAEPMEQQLSDGSWVRVSEYRTADGGYLGIWTDITALKRVETQLRDAIESINEGFALFDSDLRCVVANSRLRELYPVSGHLAEPGARLEDILRYGAQHGEYPGVEGAEAVDGFVRLWMSCFAGREAFVGESELAGLRWLMVSHHPTGSGGYVSIRADITAQKQRETELQSAKDDLEARSGELVLLAEQLEEARKMADMANLGKSQFLANMAHELRTPLNAINGFSELIVNEAFGPLQPAKYKEYVEFISQGGAHLLSLINDILDLSKIEAGKMELHIEAVATEQVVYQAAESVRKMASDRSVALRSDVANDCPILHADPRAVRQILLNLLSNAVKFTPAEGLVTIGVTRNGGDGVHISIADTGIGMTEAESAKAFELYGQVESDLTKKIKGTGLGLPLVKSLAELHGGSLSLASEKGKGTTVTVFLPWHADLPIGLS